MNKKTWGLVVGHNWKKQGAFSYSYQDHWGNLSVTTEYMYWLERYHNIRNRLAQWGVESHVITRHFDVGYRKQCEYAANDCKKYGVTHTIHGHFNSSNAKARGVEVLILDDSEYETFSMADILSDLFEESLGFKQRHGNGVLQVSEGHNGYGMLKAISKVAIPMLIEPTFANWENEESRIMLERPWLIEDVIVNYILEQTCDLCEES